MLWLFGHRLRYKSSGDLLKNAPNSDDYRRSISSAQKQSPSAPKGGISDEENSHSSDRDMCWGPILALGIAAPAAWAAPGSGGCSSGCGGANPDNPGNAEGGRATTITGPPIERSSSVTGTFAVPGGQTTGHLAQTSIDPADTGTLSGNFNSLTPIPPSPPIPSSRVIAREDHPSWPSAHDPQPDPRVRVVSAAHRSSRAGPWPGYADDRLWALDSSSSSDASEHHRWAGPTKCRWFPIRSPLMSNAAPWASTAGNKFRDVARSTENPTTKLLAEGLTALAEALRELDSKLETLEHGMTRPG
jgi:hypothetical protein